MKLTLLDSYARCKLDASQSPLDAGLQVIAAVSAARAQRIARLLVDLRGMPAAPKPTVTQRYDLGYEIARAGGGMRQIAFVMNHEDVALYDFTFLVLSNRGPQAAGFPNEQEALAWLLAPPGGSGGNLPRHLCH